MAFQGYLGPQVLQDLSGYLVTKETEALLEPQVYQAFQGQRVKQDELYRSLDLLGQMAFLGHLVSLDPKDPKVFKVSLAHLVYQGLQELLAWMVCQVHQVYKVKKVNLV
ncbi:hypothetical protein LUU34_00295000 [Aix galericulata]|nr:hypothetical protein LUU34_00295000 [Aix galericulata]